MISIVNGALITRQLIACEFIGPNVINSQLVRWRRKPLWLGTAKSKIFRVPKRPVIPKEDYVELMRLNNNYRTYRESIRRYFMNQVVENMVQFDEETVRRAEEEDFARCAILNDEWNKTVAVSREKRESDALEARKERVLRGLVAKERKEKYIMERIEEQVRKAKMEAPTFITEHNIDQAIDEALANPISHNYVIDLMGNKYEGKYDPVEKESRKKESLQQ